MRTYGTPSDRPEARRTWPAAALLAAALACAALAFALVAPASRSRRSRRPSFSDALTTRARRRRPASTLRVRSVAGAAGEVLLGDVPAYIWQRLRSTSSAWSRRARRLERGARHPDLHATDRSGVASVEAGVDGAELRHAPRPARDAATSSGQGVHTVRYRARDKSEQRGGHPLVHREHRRGRPRDRRARRPCAQGRACHAAVPGGRPDAGGHRPARGPDAVREGARHAASPAGARRALVHTAAWRATLPRGTYRLWVYATDQAGNSQTTAGSARLVVR